MNRHHFCKALQIYFQTSMHSSRMRTARLLTVSGWGVCLHRWQGLPNLWGRGLHLWGTAQPWGVCIQGVCIWGVCPTQRVCLGGLHPGESAQPGGLCIHRGLPNPWGGSASGGLPTPGGSTSGGAAQPQGSAQPLGGVCIYGGLHLGGLPNPLGVCIWGSAQPRGSARGGSASRGVSAQPPRSAYRGAGKTSLPL